MGLKRVILPKGNEKDLRDLPEEVRQEMHFTFAEVVKEVLDEMLPTLKPAPKRNITDEMAAD
jgi:ATP-dependent Lon protease